MVVFNSGSSDALLNIFIPKNGCKDTKKMLIEKINGNRS